MQSSNQYKIISQLQAFKLMPPSWGSQWILSAPPQPMWGTNNILIWGHANIGRSTPQLKINALKLFLSTGYKNTKMRTLKTFSTVINLQPHTSSSNQWSLMYLSAHQQKWECSLE